MRKLSLFALCLLFAVPLFAQNTDIEALSGLQFNFGNPGARSLGMGGAFLGLADDASAAEANPAGLTILRKPEVSVEGRNYLEQQILTTSGTYPNNQRTAFSHYSNRVEVTFASAVIPVKDRFTFGFYYHEPLRNSGAGQVVPVRNEFTGQLEHDVPDFYLPAGGGNPMTKEACEALRLSTQNDYACLQYLVNPFLTALDVKEQTFGVAGAFKVGKFSFGATARYQTFSETAFTYRISATTYEPQSFAVQSTAEADGANLKQKQQHDVTFAAGVKFELNDKISAGAVYKKGPLFVAPTFIANVNTGWDFVKLADTKFHMPDVYGVGVSVRPIPVLTVNVDGVRVKYSNLVDDMVSTIADVRGIERPYIAPDATEIHVGAEYFFSSKIPFAIRGGFWRDPAHSTQWNGPITSGEAVGAALLYPKGEAQNHFSVGGGLAWPKFQVDFAYDTAKTYKVGSISVVTRF